jgi:hypothetical protein
VAVSSQEISNFVMANLDNPSAIAQAAQQYGVSSSDIASAVGVPVSTVTSYFSNAGIAAPPITSAPVTPSGVKPVSQPTPGASSVASNVVGAFVGGNGAITNTYSDGTSVTYSPTGAVIASTNPNIGVTPTDTVTPTTTPSPTPAPTTTGAFVPEVANDPSQEFNTTYNTIQKGGVKVVDGQVVDASGNVLPANPVSIGNNQYDLQIGSAGGIIHTVVNTNPSTGQVAPITDYNKQVSYTGGVPGGALLKDIVAIGLAYALPIIGEAIAAELAVSTSVGTALAAIGTGVAQGKSIEDSITSAAPALIAGGIMSQLEIGNLVGQISTDPNLQNVINNVANSTVSTALKGGTAKDIFNNALASGGGTIIGQALTPDLGTYGASIVGQGLATGAVTGSGLAGLTASAGTAGGLQATQNSYMRDIDNVLNSQASGVTPQKVSLDFVDLSQGTQVAGPGGLPNDGFKPGQMTQTATGLFTTLRLSDGSIVNVPVQYNQGSNSLTTNSTNPEIVNQVKLLKITPENITKINPVFLDKTPINPNISAQEQADLNKVSGASQRQVDLLKAGKSVDEYYNTYAYIQSLGTTANLIADELAKDPTGVDPSYDKMRAEYQKITGIPFNIASPATDLGEIIVTGKVIKSDPTTNTSTIQTPDGVTINVNSVLPKDSSVAVNKTTSAVIPTSVTNQTAKTDTSPVSTTDTTTTPTSNVSSSNVTITSGGTNNASNIRSNVGTNLAQNIINLLSSNAASNVSTTPTSNVTITSTGQNNIGRNNISNVTITGGTGNNVGNNISNIANVTITGGTTNNIATVISPTPSANVTITGGGPNNAVNNASDNNVSITTSYVPRPPLKASYPTIVGQFASPLTQAVSAYRPPGDIESQATGKEREDVWNTESLRNALGI